MSNQKSDEHLAMDFVLGGKEGSKWYKEQLKRMMDYRKKMAEDIESLCEEFNLSPYDTISSLTSMLKDDKCMTNSQKENGTGWREQGGGQSVSSD